MELHRLMDFMQKTEKSFFGFQVMSATSVAFFFSFIEGVVAIRIEEIVGFTLLGVLAFLWFKSGKKPIKKEKPGDIFQVRRIDEDGMILTEDGRYMLMLEVYPISMELRSEREQMMIWSIFKNWLSALPHPSRWRVESQPHNFGDYFQELRARAISSQDQRQVAYVEELQEYFGQIFEQDTMRDKSYYLFLEIDERFFSDVNIDIPVLTDILSRNRVNREQDEEIARKELFNSAEFTQSVFMSIGIQTKLMRRDDVIEYLYRNANRDIAPMVPLKTMKEMGVMEEGKKISLTALRG